MNKNDTKQLNLLQDFFKSLVKTDQEKKIIELLGKKRNPREVMDELIKFEPSKDD